MSSGALLLLAISHQQLWEWSELAHIQIQAVVGG